MLWRVMPSGHAMNQEIQGGISTCASLNVRLQFNILVLIYSCKSLKCLWARDRLTSV